jgi:hypothetical protein
MKIKEWLYTKEKLSNLLILMIILSNLVIGINIGWIIWGLK